MNEVPTGDPAKCRFSKPIFPLRNSNMTSKAPNPPKHLSASSKRLWASILEDWNLDDSASQNVLQATLESRDRAEKCRKLINRDGELVTDRFGQAKANPLLAAERDSRAQFLAGLRQLGLEVPSHG